MGYLGIAAAALAVCVAVIVGAWMFVRRQYGMARQKEGQAARLLEEAQTGIDQLKKEALIEAKEEGLRLRREIDKENRERRQEIQRGERRLAQKEENLERKIEQVEQKERQLAAREGELARLRDELSAALVQERAELERVSGLSTEEAKQLLLAKVEGESRYEAAKLAKRIEDEAREEAEEQARKIISLAIQRCAVDHVAETTVSVVPLPNDEMKGRIIGREGRNIRSFENMTGVDLIIDDTPEAVVISGFDAVRREIARVALENLVNDGRIHPGRIEETIERARANVEKRIRDAGEQAVLDVGVTGLHPELVQLLGKLHFRTSFGQNVLSHSIECAHLAGVLAAELEANVALAKRAALLHDLGKAVDYEVEGTHASIGRDLAKHFGEHDEVVHAVGAHHGDEEFQTVEAVLTQVADAISAARPGARRESLEGYVRRLEKLEQIADSHPGVEKAFAIQAGREIRIMVKPETVDDVAAAELAKQVVKSIEEGLEYPGQIKVTVIRETRAIEYAK